MLKAVGPRLPGIRERGLSSVAAVSGSTTLRPAAADAPPSEAPARQVELIDKRLSPLQMLHATLQHRALVARLGIRVIIKGYSGAKLGRLWLVLRPAIAIVGMALLFGAVLDAPSNGVPYILFLLVGMLAWLTFERFLFWATRSFDTYRRVAAALDFPLLVVPTASAMAAGIEFCVFSGFIVVATVVFLLADGRMYIEFGAELLLVPAGLLLALALAWGMGLWLAVLNAKARDVRIVLRYVLRVWMYVTPVLYPVSALPGTFGFLATINPVAAPVEMVKAGLIGAGDLRLEAIAVSVGCAIAACVSGLWFFCVKAPSLLASQPAGLVDDEEETI